MYLNAIAHFTVKFPLNPKKWLNKFFNCVYNVYIVYIQYNELVGGLFKW